MGEWRIKLGSQAIKDAKKPRGSHLQKKADELFCILKQNPFQKPPSFEKLGGDLRGLYSRRINIQHRLIYQIFKEEKIVHVLRMWTHYE